METYLQHHGVQGQKWGVRRYQNPDGTLTSEGRARLGYSSTPKIKDKQRISLTPEQKAKIKKGVVIGAVAAGTALAVYGLYKTGQLGKAAKVGKSAVNRLLNNVNPNFVGPVKGRASAAKAAKGAKNIAKESVKNAADNFVKGIPSGAGEMGNKMGKVVGGGIMALAAKEIADIVVGEDTAKILLDAYNSHQKKDNKVKPINNRKDDDD